MQQQISTVLRTFPELINTPSDPSQINMTSASFFTPARQTEVFARLAERASEAGHSSKTRDLVEKCREIWGISSQREKEKEVEGIAQRWIDSVDTDGEAEWGRHLAISIKDLLSGFSSTEVPACLESVLDKAFEMLSMSVATIFPTTDLPPPRPPPSLLAILQAGSGVFFAPGSSKNRLDDIADEVKGMAVGEYVMAAEQFGGLSRDSSEGLEKLAKWIDHEIKNVRRSWKDGIPS